MRTLTASDAAKAVIIFSPAGFEEFLKATSVPAPINAVAPTEPTAVAFQNVFELAAAMELGLGIDAGEIERR